MRSLTSLTLTESVFKIPEAKEIIVKPVMSNISYIKPKEHVDKVKKVLKVSSSRAVGEETFDYFFKHEIEWGFKMAKTRMGKSYEEINYAIRPAKCIERKMLCEAFRKLSVFGDVKNYRYIGFGSPFFNDFYLFHKNLSINNMICIEKHEEDKERFELEIKKL